MSTHTIAVLGGSGGTGRLFIDRALAAGHRVRALVRDAAKLGLTHPGLIAVAGDATDPAALDAVLEGATAVASGLGTAMSGGDLHVRVMPPLAAAMQARGVKRYLSVTSAAISLATDVWKPADRATMDHVLAQAPRYAADKRAELETVRGAGFAWTLLRATTLSDETSAAYGVSLHTVPDLKRLVSRAAMAHAMLDGLEQNLWVGDAPFITQAS